MVRIEGTTFSDQDPPALVDKETHQLCDVYQPAEQDGVGNTFPKPQFYSTFEEALKACNGYEGVKPLKRKALTLRCGRVWLLEGEPVVLLANTEQLERQVALGKLTERERSLLGIK